MNENNNAFAVHPSFLGRKVFIKMPYPLPDPSGKIGFLGFEAFLKEDLGSSLYLIIEGRETIFPKSRIQQIDKLSDLAIATMMPVPGNQRDA